MSLYVGQYNIERAELGFSVQALCLSSWFACEFITTETERSQRRNQAQERPTEGDHLGNINY